MFLSMMQGYVLSSHTTMAVRHIMDAMSTDSIVLTNGATSAVFSTRSLIDGQTVMDHELWSDSPDAHQFENMKEGYVFGTPLDIDFDVPIDTQDIGEHSFRTWGIKNNMPWKDVFVWEIQDGFWTAQIDFSPDAFEAPFSSKEPHFVSGTDAASATHIRIMPLGEKISVPNTPTDWAIFPHDSDFVHHASHIHNENYSDVYINILQQWNNSGFVPVLGQTYYWESPALRVSGTVSPDMSDDEENLSIIASLIMDIIITDDMGTHWSQDKHVAQDEIKEMSEFLSQMLTSFGIFDTSLSVDEMQIFLLLAVNIDPHVLMNNLSEDSSFTDDDVYDIDFWVRQQKKMKSFVENDTYTGKIDFLIHNVQDIYKDYPDAEVVEDALLSVRDKCQQADMLIVSTQENEALDILTDVIHQLKEVCDSTGAEWSFDMPELLEHTIYDDFLLDEIVSTNTQKNYEYGFAIFQLFNQQKSFFEGNTLPNDDIATLPPHLLSSYARLMGLAKSLGIEKSDKENNYLALSHSVEQMYHIPAPFPDIMIIKWLYEFVNNIDEKSISVIENNYAKEYLNALHHLVIQSDPQGEILGEDKLKDFYAAKKMVDEYHPDLSQGYYHEKQQIISKLIALIGKLVAFVPDEEEGLQEELWSSLYSAITQGVFSPLFLTVVSLDMDMPNNSSDVQVQEAKKLINEISHVLGELVKDTSALQEDGCVMVDSQVISLLFDIEDVGQGGAVLDLRNRCLESMRNQLSILNKER